MHSILSPVNPPLLPVTFDPSPPPHQMGTVSGAMSSFVSGRLVDTCGVTRSSRLLPMVVGRCSECSVHWNDVNGGKRSSSSCGNCERNWIAAPLEPILKSRTMMEPRPSPEYLNATSGDLVVLEKAWCHVSELVGARC